MKWTPFGTLPSAAAAAGNSRVQVRVIDSLLLLRSHSRQHTVQRLVQRFDSTGTQFIEQQRQQQQHQRTLGSPRTTPTGTTASWPRGEDAERLLAVLGQLVGGQNVRRLLDTLRRFDQEQQRQQGGDTSSACATAEAKLMFAVPPATDNWRPNQHQLRRSTAATTTSDERRHLLPLLDLRKLNDRRLALALLKFLADLARKAISEIQIGGHLDNRQPAAAALPSEQSQRLLSGEQSATTATGRDRDQNQVSGDDQFNCLALEVVEPNDSAAPAGGSQAAPNLCKSTRRPPPESNERKVDSSSSTAAAAASLAQRHWPEKQQQQIDKPFGGDNSSSSTRVHRQQKKNGERQPADNQEIVLSTEPFVDGRPPPRQRQRQRRRQQQIVDRDETGKDGDNGDDDEDDDDDDPIMRTLECIMGSGTGAAATSGSSCWRPSAAASFQEGNQRQRNIHGRGTDERNSRPTNDNNSVDQSAGAITNSVRRHARRQSPTAVTGLAGRDNNLHCGAACRTGTRDTDVHPPPGLASSSPAHTSRQQQLRQKCAPANELSASGALSGSRQAAQLGGGGGQVIGQSINGGQPNHRNSAGQRTCQRAPAGCCEIAKRRSSSRSRRCCCSSKSSPNHRDQHGDEQRGVNMTGEQEAVSSCNYCCCGCSSRSTCGRTGRRRHRTRTRSRGSRSGSCSGTTRATSSSTSQAEATRNHQPRAQSSSPPQQQQQASEATAYKYLNKNIPADSASGGSSGRNHQDEQELVEDKL